MPVKHHTIQKLIHGDSVISFLCKNYLELKFNILSSFICKKGLFQFVLVPECKLPTVSIVLKQHIFEDLQTLPLIGPYYFCNNGCEKTILGTFTKMWKVNISLILSAYLHRTTRLILDKFSWSFVSGTFFKICA